MKTWKSTKLFFIKSRNTVKFLHCNVALSNCLRSNKGQCTTGPMATTVQSSKQLINEFWHTVQSIILRKSNFGPNLTFRTPWGLGKSFPKGKIYIVGSVLLVSNFMQKIKKMCHAVQKIFLKKSILGPKFDLLTPGGPEQEFS